MRNWLKRNLVTLVSVFIIAVAYSIGMVLFAYFFLNYKTSNEILYFINSPIFYIVITIGVILVILRRILTKQAIYKIGRTVMLVISYIIIFCGCLFIGLSYIKPIWEEDNLSFNLNAFGVGISLGAVGFAFLFAFLPLTSKEDEKEQVKSTRFDREINKLSKETDKIEGILLDCKKIKKEMKILKEEADNRTEIS